MFVNSSLFIDVLDRSLLLGKKKNIMTKNKLKDKKGLFFLQLVVRPSRKARAQLAAGTEPEAMEDFVYWLDSCDLFSLLSCSMQGYQPKRCTATVNGSFHFSYQARKCTIGLNTGQSSWGLFSNKVLSAKSSVLTKAEIKVGSMLTFQFECKMASIGLCIQHLVPI